MSAPACHISQEGIVYGYVREISWVKGSESQKMTAITPFAFKAQVDKDSLIVSDFRMFGWDVASHKAVLGTYRMSPERSAKTPTPAEPKIQR